MKKLLGVCGIIILVSGFGYGDQVYRSGNYVVAKGSGSMLNLINKRVSSVPLSDTVEALVNGGFETGGLLPWTTTNWTVTDIDSHTGQYCACDVGNYWIRQDFTPVLTDSIVSVTFWSRQPEAAIQAFDFMYDDGSYDEDIIYVQATWQMFDVTSYLPSGRTMIGFRLWGYSGGGPLPDSTYVDDVSILVETEGQDIEERKPAIHQLDFNICPNPIRDKAIITCANAAGRKILLSIYDIQGSIIEQIHLDGKEYVWRTQGLMSGVYFIRIQMPGKQESVQKILVLE